MNILDLLTIEVGNLLRGCYGVELVGCNVCEFAYFLGSALVGIDLIA